MIVTNPLYVLSRRRIAVSRGLDCLSADPVRDRQGSGIQTGDDAEDGQRDIGDLLSGRSRAGFEVQEGLGWLAW